MASSSFAVIVLGVSTVVFIRLMRGIAMILSHHLAMSTTMRYMGTQDRVSLHFPDFPESLKLLIFLVIVEVYVIAAMCKRRFCRV